MSFLFSRKGLFTPEPDEGILNSSGLPPGKTGQQCSSTLPQMIDRRQSRVANLFTARASTPRPGESTIIMVNPYLGERKLHSEVMAKHFFSLIDEGFARRMQLAIIVSAGKCITKDEKRGKKKW